MFNPPVRRNLDGHHRHLRIQRWIERALAVCLVLGVAVYCAALILLANAP